jgi:trk system potassium uptake protein TrkH
MVICLGIMLLLITEIGQVPHAQSRGRFLELFFEVVSAFGTVGLSTGITGWLSEIGKIVLSMVMFVGRLGPLVVGVAVSRDTAARYYYAEESIMVG